MINSELDGNLGFFIGKVQYPLDLLFWLPGWTLAGFGLLLYLTGGGFKAQSAYYAKRLIRPERQEQSSHAEG